MHRIDSSSKPTQVATWVWVSISSRRKMWAWVSIATESVPWEAGGLELSQGSGVGIWRWDPTCCLHACVLPICARCWPLPSCVVIPAMHLCRLSDPTCCLLWFIHFLLCCLGVQELQATIHTLLLAPLLLACPLPTCCSPACCSLACCSPACCAPACSFSAQQGPYLLASFPPT